MLAFGYNAVVCHTKTLQVRGCFRHLNLGLACVEMKSGLNAFIIFKTWFPLNVSGLQRIGVVCSRERCCVLEVSIGNRCWIYCEVFCIWRDVNRVAHPVLS